MKLITHNILMCNKKGCTTNNFPLKIVCNKVEMYQEEATMAYSKNLMQRLLEKLDLPALKITLDQLNWQDVRPLFPTPEMMADPGSVDVAVLREDEEFLTNLHEICCKRHITEGQLICPNCERSYEIKTGIVNMLLNEDEV